MAEHCHEEPTDTPEEEFDISISGTLRTAQTVTAMQRLPEDLRLEHNPDKQGEEMKDWVINKNRPKMIQDSDVSVVGKDPPISMIMEVLEEELKVVCDRAVRNAPIRGAMLYKNLVHKPGSSMSSVWHYTNQQKYILHNLDKSFCVLDCIAGSGKSTILVSVALWTPRQRKLGGQGCLHYMTETQEMVTEFVQRVQEVQGSSEGTAAIGFEREANVDRSEEHLRERLKQKKIPIVVAVSQLENTLCFLKDRVSTVVNENNTDWDIFFEIFKGILTIPHVMTHRTYCSEKRKAQAEELLGLTIIACTTATANRLNGGNQPWSETFGKLEKALAVCDECQKVSRLEVAGVFIKSY